MADHMGQVHDEVDKYLPADNRNTIVFGLNLP